MSFEATTTSADQLNRRWWIACGVAVTLFWMIRVAYWSSVEELPFSDMGNFDDTARRVASHFDFRWSEFWQTYSTPSLVTARALQILVAGEGMLPWRIFQSLLVCGGLVWLAWELFKSTGSRGLAIGLLVIVAIAKPSIFWSLKLSRESFAEAAGYLTAASFLFALRQRSIASYLLLGLILAAGFLNRPTSILVVPCVVALIVWDGWRRNTSTRNHFGVGTTGAVLAVAVGIAVLWTPWIVRSMKIYGEPVLLSTQGPYSLLWELGQVEVTLRDGRVVKTDVNTLQAEAAQNFPTDLAASRYAAEIARAWMIQQGWRLPRIMFSRIRGTIASRTEYLTKVSRDRLFDTPMNRLLLDKSTITIYLGVAGLIALPFVFSMRLWIIPIAALLPWLSAGAMISYSRMLDASVPLILFGILAGVVAISRGLTARREATVGAS